MKCGNEGEFCTCPYGYIHYGAKDKKGYLEKKETTISSFVGYNRGLWAKDYKEASGRWCTTKGIGKDPAPGKEKSCYCNPWKKNWYGYKVKFDKFDWDEDMSNWARVTGHFNLR